MAGKGWGGQPPCSDAEARLRILEAAGRCLDRYGAAKTGLSDVAAELKVTRQTVYRHFASTTELLLACSEAAADSFIERIAQHCSPFLDPAEIIVEGLVFVITHIPTEPRLSVLLAVDRADLFTIGITSPTALRFGHAMLRRFTINWAALGYDDSDIDELAEHLLRVTQSLLIDPGHPPRATARLRRYLARWVGPVVTKPPTMAYAPGG